MLPLVTCTKRTAWIRFLSSYATSHMLAYQDTATKIPLTSVIIFCSAATASWMQTLTSSVEMENIYLGLPLQKKNLARTHACALNRSLLSELDPFPALSSESDSSDSSETFASKYSFVQSKHSVYCTA